VSLQAPSRIDGAGLLLDGPQRNDHQVRLVVTLALRHDPAMSLVRASSTHKEGAEASFCNGQRQAIAAAAREMQQLRCTFDRRTARLQPARRTIRTRSNALETR
jgi:hypothetical protein